MDLDKLLIPYKDGGTADRPVIRSIGTILDYLLNKKQYPMEIVGGAIFIVFNFLDNGGEFKGDGSYGSKGRELVTSIRMKCDELMRAKLETETYKAFMALYGKQLRAILLPPWKRKLINWWYGREIYK